MTGLLAAGSALIAVGVAAAVWVALLRCPCETAASGAGRPDADGAACTAGPISPAAVPAPAAPTTSPVGAAGVTPWHGTVRVGRDRFVLVAMAALTPDDPALPVDPVDADVEERALVLGGGR